MLPRSPSSRACATAVRECSTARGYSLRTYMYPLRAPIARAPIIIPSRTKCGLPSSKHRSIYAPGSPSSALQITYFSSPGASQHSCHLRPVGNPPPPRPRSLDSFISLIILSGVTLLLRTLARAVYPPATI